MANPVFASCCFSEQAFWRSKTSRSSLNQVVKILLFFFAFAELVNIDGYFWFVIYDTIPKEHHAVAILLCACLNIVLIIADYIILIKEHLKFAYFITFLSGLSFFGLILAAIEWKDNWFGCACIGMMIEMVLFVIFGIGVIRAVPSKEDVK